MSSSPYKILIIGPSWVGDMVMAQSLFIRLKALHPDAIIDVLALAWTQPLLDRMPEVRRAIAMPISHGVLDIKSRYVLGKQLRSEQYDQAIILPNSWKSALIPWFAKIPIRTGWKGEARYGLLNDLRVLDKQALPMMVERFVSLAHLADQCGSAPDYPIPNMVAQSVEFDVTPPEAGQRRIVLCPGAEFGPAKQWPASSYAKLAEKLIQQGCQLLILGSQADNETAQTITANVSEELHDQLFNLCGQTQLQDAIDLLNTADVVVSNDSGLMHIGAALQRPLVAIYGPTSPGFTPPLSDNSKLVQIDVDCGPCFQRTCPEGHHRCMIGIDVDKVLNLIKIYL